MAGRRRDLKLVADDAPTPASLGARVRALRRERGLSLQQLGAAADVPHSTLSKFETDLVSLPVDRLFRIADALGVATAGLLDPPAPAATMLPGRRSVTRCGAEAASENGNYAYRWHASELRQRLMTPVVQTVRVRDIDTFGPLLRHGGEEFVYVLAGRLRVVTEAYEPVELGPGDSIYIDSRMGHAFLDASDGEQGATTILNVSTGADGDHLGK